MPFKNPYSFLPLAPAVEAESLTRDQFRDRQLGVATHSRYTRGAFSGRIICRLKTETPMVIGGERHPGAPSLVEPYEIDGVPAIPASSLRGMISHIAEAASGSALRVLGNQTYSFRKPADAASLSAIGLVVAGPDGTLALKPLCLPTMAFAGTTGPAHLTGGFRAPMWPFPILKFYLGDKPTITGGGFTLKTWHPKHNNVFHAIPLARYVQLQFNGDSLLHPPLACLHTKDGQPDLALAQQICPPGGAPRDLTPADLTRWDSIPVADRPNWVRGIVRVLGCNEAVREDIPKGKKHELFIPFPDALEKSDVKLPIPPAVRQRFDDLSMQRSEEHAKSLKKEYPGPGDPPAGYANGKLWPYEPRGTRPHRDVHNPGLVLEAGDLVYFRPSDDGLFADEVAFSSIWRGRVEDQNRPIKTDEFFRRSFARSPQAPDGPGLELLPMNPTRQRITIAEQLFGFVEMSREDNAPLKKARALAGRLRPAPALLDPASLPPGQDAYLRHANGGPQTLRILASPKPPSTAMYFRQKGQNLAWFPPKELKPNDHLPHGRKHYLNHTGPYTSTPQHDPKKDKLRLKAAVTPVRKGAVYYFHLDFDNLSRTELSLLLYSLKPYPGFMHKIGMGKPLGLGSVSITVAGVFFVDRQARYTGDGLLEARYSDKFLPEGEDPSQWSDSRHQAERRACGDTKVAAIAVPEAYQPVGEVGVALKRLGVETSQVMYPQTVTQQQNGGRPELNLFEWFVNNARPHVPHQAMAPAAHGNALPTLQENA